MKNAFALLLLAAVAAAEPSLPSDPKGQVTLSWDKFNDVWKTLQDLTKKVNELEKPIQTPPVPYALGEAAYRGTIRPGRAEIEALFSVDVFEPKGWVKVPLLPADVAVTRALMDGRPLGLVQENGAHAAVIRGAGRHLLRLTLAIRAPKEEEAPALALPLPAAASTVVSLFFPQPRLDVTVEGAQGQELRAENGGTRVTASLPPASAFTLRWHKALPAEKALPRKMYVDGDALFTVSEGALRGRWTMRYTVLHQGTQQITLKMPEGWNVLGVSTEGMEDWKVLESADGQRLQVNLTYPKKGALELTVEAERGLADKEDVVPLPRLAPLDVERETGVIAIQAKGAVEVTVPEARGVQPLDPQELPPALWGQAREPILHAFRHTGRPVLSVGVTRHPDVPVLTTTIDLANGLTLMTKRGETVTRVQYHVRNRVKQHLAVKLPGEAELWSAFVAGEPVKPTRLPDGAYQLPLRRSGDGGADDVLVEVVYFLRRAPLGWAGRRGFDLPLPDAPVSRAMWSLYLPPEARALSFDGDMDRVDEEVIPLSSPEPQLAGGMIQEALKKVARRMSFRDEEKEERMRADMAAPASLQAKLLEDTFGEKDGARAAGVFPVYFQIPEEGALYHFGRSMIVGESPRVKVAYARSAVLQGMWAFFFAALAAALYRGRRRFAPAWRGLKSLIHHEDTAA